MKKLLFIAICFVSLNLSAQGNLQFNQVTSVTITGNLSAMSSITTNVTVPAGKVWKIQSASSGYYSSTVYMRDASGNFLATLYSSNLGYRVNFPYWLPSGFTGDFIRYGNTGSGPKSTVSIIEFNVIP